jgi:hypothetical protein
LIKKDKRPTLCFDLCVDGWTLSDGTHDHTKQSIGSAKSRVNERTNTNKTTGDGELKLVLLGKKRNDTRS